MSEKVVIKEEDIDICPKSGKPFSEIKEECERCELCDNCRCLNSRPVREGKMGNVICPKTGDPVHSSQCSDCEDNMTCRVLNL